uniref:Uncharacterized protein n=1 Tax=Oryza glumipatula TaxID=40148 RepID=A0A0D9YPY2_9ORYZ
MAVATNGAAAASPCLRHAHLLGLLIEAHPVEKFLWAKFKMQGDIMILLSDITLQVKVKLPYTDMMILQGEIRPQIQLSLCPQTCANPQLFTAQIHPNKTMFNLVR